MADKYLFLYMIGGGMFNINGDHDYLQHMVADGFFNICGQENCIYFPSISGDEKIKNDYNTTYNWKNIHNYTKEDIIKMIKNKEFRAIIAGYWCWQPYVDKWNIIKEIKDDTTPFIYIDGSEGWLGKIDKELFKYKIPKLYFQREYPIGRELKPEIQKIFKPLPFCSVPDHNKPYINSVSKKKLYDLIFIGYIVITKKRT